MRCTWSLMCLIIGMSGRWDVPSHWCVSSQAHVWSMRCAQSSMCLIISTCLVSEMYPVTECVWLQACLWSMTSTQSSMCLCLVDEMRPIIECVWSQAHVWSIRSTQSSMCDMCLVDEMCPFIYVSDHRHISGLLDLPNQCVCSHVRVWSVRCTQPLMCLITGMSLVSCSIQSRDKQQSKFWFTCLVFPNFHHLTVTHCSLKFCDAHCEIPILWFRTTKHLLALMLGDVQLVIGMRQVIDSSSHRQMCLVIGTCVIIDAPDWRYISGQWCCIPRQVCINPISYLQDVEL